MPTYIYGCENKDHPRIKMKHGIKIEMRMRCFECGGWLHRVPQPFRFYLSPIEILRDWSERNWTKKLRGEPRDYRNVASAKGIPQKDFDTRRSTVK